VASGAKADSLIVPAGGATANITGCAVVTMSTIGFGASASGSTCSITSTFTAASPDTGSYSGLTGGTLKMLTGGPATGVLAMPITDFATFVTPTDTVHFDLTEIDPGSGNAGACTSNTVGNSCTPPGSPFTLTQVTANKVAISLSLNGLAYINNTTNANATGALFTTQNLIPGTITGILAQVTSPGGFTADSFSATFVSSAVPEPGTLTMLCAGVGMLGISFISRKRRS
ncbi:MAG TPA: PEP-CTERM sorting domain-containing protein, partial [Bryobacteraceae bacterium]|nr:PEP-CTERM sorting domain-containing protein [Bryobacteraceae bacterium]